MLLILISSAGCEQNLGAENALENARLQEAEEVRVAAARYQEIQQVDLKAARTAMDRVLRLRTYLYPEVAEPGTPLDAVAFEKMQAEAESMLAAMQDTEAIWLAKEQVGLIMLNEVIPYASESIEDKLILHYAEMLVESMSVQYPTLIGALERVKGHQEHVQALAKAASANLEVQELVMKEHLRVYNASQASKQQEDPEAWPPRVLLNGSNQHILNVEETQIQLRALQQ